MDTKNPQPIYEQIKNSIRKQIFLGVLVPEDKLPSVRELARTSAINPNTIQKAYRDLETEGLIYCRSGSGCFVCPISEKVKSGRIEELLKNIQPMYAELKTLGLDDSELIERLKGGKGQL